MKTFRDYWTFSAIRAVLTLVVASGMFLLPYAAIDIVKIPFMLTFATDVLGAYLLMDAGANVLLALVLPEGAKRRRVRYLHGAMALVFGATFYCFTYGGILPVGSLMYVVALEAALAAVLEAVVARDTHAQYGGSFCYSTAAVLAGCAVALLFTAGLSPEVQLVALVLYVSAYGGSQLVLAALMLFREYRGEHPVRVMVPVRPVVASAAILSCDECAAVAFCSDSSVAAQVQQVIATRRPAIVQSVRVASLTRPAGVYREATR